MAYWKVTIIAPATGRYTLDASGSAVDPEHAERVCRAFLRSEAFADAIFAAAQLNGEAGHEAIDIRISGAFVARAT